ncbi:MAG: hypothetical protein U0636_11110 [Phycisphaerales bacterium]
MISRTILAAFSLASAGLSCTAAEGSFVIYGQHANWLNAVPGPTVSRTAQDSFTGLGQPVDPEVWADVGVHLVSSGPLLQEYFTAAGAAFFSGIGQTFEVRWDTPITALWYRAQSPTGSVWFFAGSTFLGGVGDGNLGVTSTIAFDRLVISGSVANDYGFLLNLEWNAVPSPGALSALCLAPLLGGRRRRG